MLSSAAANDQNFHRAYFQRQEPYGSASQCVNSRRLAAILLQLASLTAKVFSFTLMHWDFALILLFLGIAVPLLGRRRVRQLMLLPATTKMDRLSLYASTLAFQWIALALILWRVNAHGIRVAQLGVAIPSPVPTLISTVVLAILVLLNQIFSLRRLVARPAEIQGFLPQLALKLFPQDDVERLVFFALVATVALCEELIYRGFVQYVFQDLLRGSIIAGILGSAIFFALAHLYQGRRGLVSTFSVGLIFSIIRALTGSLVPCFVAHFVADITVGMLAPPKLSKALTSHPIQSTENKGDISI